MTEQKFVPRSLVRVDGVDDQQYSYLIGKWLYVKEDHGEEIELFVPPEEVDTIKVKRYNLYALYHHVKV